MSIKSMSSDSTQNYGTLSSSVATTETQSKSKGKSIYVICAFHMIL